MRVGAMTGQVGTGHGVPFHDGAGERPAWDLMVHHDMVVHSKTSDDIARANTTCHTHTSHGMESHDMAWHETPRKWRERSPMILAPLARACTGVRNPRARPTRPLQTYFCAGTTSALKVLSCWSKASRRHMRCVFLKYTYLFFLVTVKVPHVTLTHLEFRRFVRSRRFHVNIMWRVAWKRLELFAAFRREYTFQMWRVEVVYGCDVGEGHQRCSHRTRENKELSIECLTSSIHNTCSTEPHSDRESQEQVVSDGWARNVTSHRRTEWWVVDVGSWRTSPVWPPLFSRLQNTRLKNARQDQLFDVYNLSFTEHGRDENEIMTRRRSKEPVCKSVRLIGRKIKHSAWPESTSRKDLRQTRIDPYILDIGVATHSIQWALLRVEPVSVQSSFS